MYSGVFSIDLVGLLVLALACFPYIFFKMRNLVPYPVKSTLKLTDYYILCTLLVYLVTGVYQQYFWTKKNKIKKEVKVPKIFLDNWISKNSDWVYVYNFVYYLIFGLVIISVKNYKHFAVLMMGSIALMTGLSVIWYLLPNVVDTRIDTDNYYLKKVQAIDTNTNNAAPSAHVVLSVYSYYILRNVIGEIPALCIPIIVSTSCLKTSQHHCIDVVSGVIFTVAFYNLIFKRLSPSVFL